MIAYIKVLGSAVSKKEPVLHGMPDILISQFKKNALTEKFLIVLQKTTILKKCVN